MRIKSTMIGLVVVAMLALAVNATVGRADPCRVVCSCQVWTTAPIGWDTVPFHGLPEFVYFARAYNYPPEYDPIFDYDCNGRIDLTDFAISAPHYQH